MSTPSDTTINRRGRFLALFIVAVMVLWMGAQLIGGQLGLEARYAFLFDLAAIAALIWALIGIYQLWRARQNQKG